MYARAPAQSTLCVTRLWQCNVFYPWYILFKTVPGKSQVYIIVSLCVQSRVPCHSRKSIEFLQLGRLLIDKAWIFLRIPFIVVNGKCYFLRNKVRIMTALCSRQNEAIFYKKKKTVEEKDNWFIHCFSLVIRIQGEVMQHRHYAFKYNKTLE